MMGLSTTVQFQTPPIFKPSATDGLKISSATQKAWAANHCHILKIYSTYF